MLPSGMVTAGQRPLLHLDHITVVAPDLAEGVAHVRACLDLDVPFGQRHGYMGTHNHLLQLGGSIYLEIVALDPDGRHPGRARWFGLDDQAGVRRAWDDGRRLRGWVARVDGIDAVLAGREAIFGRKVALPPIDSSFDFAIPEDGSLPLDGAMPSLIDRRGKARSMAAMADLGARLQSLVLAHPERDRIAKLYNELAIDRPPDIVQGAEPSYLARIETPAGMKELT